MLVVGLILHFTGKKISFVVVELFCMTSVMLLKYVFGYSPASGQISDTRRKSACCMPTTKLQINLRIHAG